MNLRSVRRVLWGLVGVALVAALVMQLRPWAEDAPIAMSATLAIDDPYLKLTDHTGARFDTRSLAGDHVLMYFGFTYCPDVCPISSLKMAQAKAYYDVVGAAPPLHTVFISIDPARDAAAQLEQYRAAMGGKLIAMSGTPEEIEAAKAAFKVYAQKRSSGEDDEDYLFDHSDLIYWVDPAGTVRFFSNQQNAGDIASAVAGYQLDVDAIDVAGAGD